MSMYRSEYGWVTKIMQLDEWNGAQLLSPINLSFGLNQSLKVVRKYPARLPQQTSLQQIVTVKKKNRKIRFFFFFASIHFFKNLWDLHV